MSHVAILRLSFTNLSAPGSISVPDLKAGDVMIWCLQTPPAGQGNVGYVFPQGEFEAIVSIDGQLQQTGNFGAGTAGTFSLDAIFLRGV